jgi:hypothetical protein
MAYREQGERPPLPIDCRRWFTKQGDAEKGPYDEDALVRAVATKLLKPTTLVRAEDETEWRPLVQVEHLRKKMTPERTRRPFDPERDLHPEAHGSFGAGFAAGFFGGCIGFFLVLAMAKGEETKRGARFGFIAQIGVGALFRVIAMMNAS